MVSLVLGREEGREGLSSVIGWVATVRVTAVAARTTPRIPIWVLNDHIRAGHILGGHGHTTVPIVGDGVHNLLLLGLNVYRYRLWVPVLKGLSVWSVHVAVATSWDGNCSRGWVLHRCRVMVWTGKPDRRIKRSAFRRQYPTPKGVMGYTPVREDKCLGGRLRDGVDSDRRCVEGHGEEEGEEEGNGEGRRGGSDLFLNPC